MQNSSLIKNVVVYHLYPCEISLHPTFPGLNRGSVYKCDKICEEESYHETDDTNQWCLPMVCNLSELLYNAFVHDISKQKIKVSSVARFHRRGR